MGRRSLVARAIALVLGGIVMPVGMGMPSEVGAVGPSDDYIVVFKDGTNVERKLAKEAGLGTRSVMFLPLQLTDSSSNSTPTMLHA